MAEILCDCTNCTETDMLFSILWSMSIVYSVQVVFIDYLFFFTDLFPSPTRTNGRTTLCMFLMLCCCDKAYGNIYAPTTVSAACFAMWSRFGSWFLKSSLNFSFSVSFKLRCGRCSLWNAVVQEACSADWSRLSLKYVCVFINSVSLLGSLGILMWFSSKRTL